MASSWDNVVRGDGDVEEYCPRIGRRGEGGGWDLKKDGILSDDGAFGSLLTPSGLVAEEWRKVFI
jgi:hypothetical protein